MKNFKKIVIIVFLAILLSFSTVFVVYAKFSYSTEVVNQEVTMPNSIKEQLENAKLSTTSAQTDSLSSTK